MFANGTEFQTWLEQNCDKCEKPRDNYAELQSNEFSGCQILNDVLDDEKTGEKVKIKKIIGMDKIGVIGICKNRKLRREFWVDDITLNLF